MDDWLDDLSEDWPSQPPSLAQSRNSQQLRSSRRASSNIQGAITHPRKASRTNHNVSSIQGSQRRKAVLSPRSASDENKQPEQISSSKIGLPIRKNVSSYGRSISAASTQSVDAGGTVAMTPSPVKAKNTEETPEWKRRLLLGDKGYGDQTDLFGPSGIQNLFQKPQPKHEENVKPKGLSFLKSLETVPSSPPWPSNDIPPHISEVEDGDDYEQENDHGLDPVCEDSVYEQPQAPPQNCDHDDVFTDGASELGSIAHHSTRRTHSAAFAESLRRSRQVSAQSAQSSNDSFSAVYIGKHRTADGGVAYAPISFSRSQLVEQLASMGMSNPSENNHRRISSQSSKSYSETPIKSDDFPDGLAHGTPDMVSIGEFVTTKRGGIPDDDSFMHRPLSPSPAKEHTNEEYLDQFEDVENLSQASQVRRTATPNSTSEYSRAPSDRTTTQQADLNARNPNPKTADRIASNASNFGQGELDGHGFPDELSSMANGSQLYDELPSRSPSPDVLPPGFQHPFKFRVDSRESLPGAIENDTFQGKRKLSKRSALSTLSVNKRNSAKRGLKAESSKGSGAGGEVSAIQPSFEGKRPPPSPFKNPTPKRRRTLLEPEIGAIASSQTSGASQRPTTIEPSKAIQESHNRVVSAIGKRKDARHGSFMLRAEAEVLSRRQILRPRNPTPSQRRYGPREEFELHVEEPTSHSLSSNPKMEIIKQHLNEPLSPSASSDAVQAHLVASEVAAFSQSISHRMKDDSRKRSVTTQDFLDEAMKIMNFIRTNGRPTSGLENVIESQLEGEEEAKHAQDQLGFSEHSSALTMSRPPSREDGKGGWRERDPLQRRPSILHHLDKYREKDTEDFMASSVGSRMGEKVKQAVHRIEALESDPSGVEILKAVGVAHEPRKAEVNRSPSCSQATARSGQSSQTSVESTLGRTIASRKSESLANLAPEAVAHLIPEEVAGMSFDHEQGIWRKNGRSRKDTTSTHREQPEERDVSEVTASEDDPLRSIPDLTFDEEEEDKRLRQQQIDMNTIKEAMLQRHRERDNSPMRTNLDSSPNQSEANHFSTSTPTPSPTFEIEEVTNSFTVGVSKPDVSHSVESFEHEIGIDEGREHQPQFEKTTRKVTVSFPANFAASIRATSATISKQDFGQIPSSPPTYQIDSIRRVNSYPQIPRMTVTAPSTATARTSPLPALDEQQEISWISVDSPQRPGKLAISAPYSAAKSSRKALVPQSSPAQHSELTFYMSDLSDFTIHQTDERQLATRTKSANANSLEDRYAWGNHLLVKALQDSEPEEPYWEDLRAVDLRGKAMTSLHLLDELCPQLENANLSVNKLQQLSGAPSSLRCLDIHQNMLTSLSWWGHLTNLQYLDVSNNNIDSLTGFSYLVHLRELKADHNRITSLDGLHDMDGLLKLSLRSNHLKDDLDLEGFQLSRLETLDIGINAITTMRGFQWLPALRNLNLESNKIERFSTAETDVCSRLELLNLAANELSSISLANCFPNLRTINLDDNHLSGGAIDFGSVQQMDSISLRSQDLKTNEFSLPSSLPDTTALNISLNALHTLELSSPHSLLSLQSLELSNCGLSALPENFGLSAPNLRFVNLNFNALKDLRPLLNIRRLTHLFCAGNRLSRLRKTMAVLAKLDALEVIDLRSNPFTIGFHDPASSTSCCTSSSTLVTAPVHTVPDDTQVSLLAQLQSAPLHLPWHDTHATDTAYLELLDADTRLRRRVYEMLLASSCKKLHYLDGYAFLRKHALVRDDVWERLVALGVLTRRTGKAINEA